MGDVDDDEFEEAITEAKEEGNLSRANVVRKVKPTTTDRIADAKAKHPIDDGPGVLERRRNRVREMAAAGHTKRQIASELGITVDSVTDLCKRNGIEVPADAVVGKTRLLDPNRIVSETVISLEGLVMGLDLVEVAQLDQDQIEGWATSLRKSLRSVNQFLKEMTRDQG